MSVRSLNLDSMFIPTTLPEIEFNSFKFSGGEIHIKLSNLIDYDKITKVVITNRIKSSDDLIKILMVKDALQRKGIKEFDLVMPYIPYGRQDRVCVEGEAFALKVFANIINSAKFDNVLTFDPHSGISPALIDNCKEININNILRKVCYNICVIDSSDILLISPDAGSNKKMNILYDKSLFTGLVKCDKKRDVDTGKLSGFEVFANDLQGKPCLIVDDICDGGGTFIGLAEELKKKNAGNLYLYVSHGIFSKGIYDLITVFKKIYTTNSFSDLPPHEGAVGIQQFKIQL